MGGNTLASIASNSRKGARYANQGTDDLMEFSDGKKGADCSFWPATSLDVTMNG